MSTKRSYNFFSRKVIYCYFIYSLIGLIFEVSAENRVGFNFNPPDGTAFVETLRHTKEIILPGQPSEKSVENIEGEYLIRKTQDGYLVQTKPIKPSDLRISGDIEEYVNALMSRSHLKYKLDRKGRLLGILGAEELGDELESILPKELLDPILSISEEIGKTIPQMIENQWNGRALFALMPYGQPIELERDYTYEGKIQLPMGSFNGTVRMLVTGPVPCQTYRCAKVQVFSESQDEAVGRQMAALLRGMIVNLLQALAPEEAKEAEKEIPTFRVENSRLELVNVRLIDPKTGLPYGETNSLTITGNFGLEEDARLEQFTIKDTKEYSYEYE